MKKISLNSGKIKFLSLIPLMLLFFVAGTASGQEKQEPSKSGKRLVTIHIVKESNGERTVIDTTFEESSDFDEDAWIRDRSRQEDMEPPMRDMERRMKITIPDLDLGELSMKADTIIVNGDTIFLDRIGKDLNLAFRDFPDFRDLEIEKYFDPSGKDFREHQCPKMEKKPGCCPGYRHFSMPSMPEFRDFDIPELREFMPYGNPDQIIIKKKRHGKKIIIKYEKDDDDVIILKKDRRD